eukprot:g35111.t1
MVVQLSSYERKRTCGRHQHSCTTFANVSETGSVQPRRSLPRLRIQMTLVDCLLVMSRKSAPGFNRNNAPMIKQVMCSINQSINQSNQSIKSIDQLCKSSSSFYSKLYDILISYYELISVAASPHWTV